MANRCRILMIEKKDEDTLVLKNFYSHLGGSNYFIEPALLVAKNLKLDFYDFYKMYEKAHGSDFYNEFKTSAVFNLDEVREEYSVGDNGIYIINKEYDLICKIDTNDLDEIIPNDIFINNMKNFINSNKINIDIESIKLPKKIKREQAEKVKYATNAILEKLVLTEPDLKKYIKSAILEKFKNKNIPLECLNPISINNTKYDYKRIKKDSFFLDVFEPKYVNGRHFTDIKHTYIVYYDFMNIYNLLKMVS
ncbi:hypothetical protein [Campylobacter sp. RM12651]|uniref:hypothetical protein n=1 Tax=Campylobacter sp. RM12651 TaxID=1660079 RepID=UPI001EFA77F5|nr:hypothetical protein [Campylobacter sp. RM12651]ULO04531.1 hypothetical protein AVBRAN_a0049 [Campylobacter sp. RM12651]